MVKLTNARSRLATAAPNVLVTPRPVRGFGNRRFRREAWRNWYGLKAWKDLCKQVDKRDGLQCQQTGVMLTHVPNRPNSVIHDHKIPHRGNWDLFIDPNNVQLVSKKWHDSVKQKQERDMPLGVDPTHIGGVG